MTNSNMFNFDELTEMANPPLEIKERFRALIEDSFNLMQSLARESERASVILAVARIDSDLEKLLKHVLYPKSSSSDNLFDSERPLSAFSAKIALAGRLGVIDDELESALHILRRIRNEFAHEIEASTLSSDRNRDRLAELVKRFEHTDLYKRGIELGIGEAHGNSEQQQKMLVCVTCIVIVLQIGLDKLHKVDAGGRLSP